MCLSSATIILFNQKVVTSRGEEFQVLHPSQLDGLAKQVNLESDYARYDGIERLSLAVYQLVKGHYFIEGNKRTALLVLMNCLRKSSIKYTGRGIDLSRKLVEMAQTKSQDKRVSIMEFSYFLKHRLQKNSG